MPIANLGFLRWTNTQLAQARDMLERAIKAFPDDSFAHYYLGRVELDAPAIRTGLP